MGLKIPTMVNTLARYSASNLTLLIRDEMNNVVDAIWRISGRTDTRKFHTTDTGLTEIVQTAQQKNVGAVLVRCVDFFSREEQTRLAHLLKRMPTTERGKIILTTNEFGNLESELLNSVCKIESKFKYESQLALSDDQPQSTYEN